MPLIAAQRKKAVRQVYMKEWELESEVALRVDQSYVAK